MNMVRRHVRGTAALVALLIPIHATAADNDAEAWLVGTANGSLSGKLLGTLELGARHSNDPTRRLTTLFRPSLGYQVTPKVSLWLGYARFNVYPDDRPAILENRLFQQVSWSIGRVAGGSLTSRTRLEQRMFEGRDDTGWRARQNLRWVRPIGADGVSAVLSSEVFVALNSTDFGARAGFDQSRNFVGANLPLAKGLSIEGGYMHRYVRRVGISDRIDHILPVTIAWRW
jgi:hypothetical protein